MPAVHIRSVPADVVEALKQRAARNQRSLEGELRTILAAVVQEERPVVRRKPLDLRLSTAQPRGDWRREEIYGDDGR